MDTPEEDLVLHSAPWRDEEEAVAESVVDVCSSVLIQFAPEGRLGEPDDECIVARARIFDGEFASTNRGRFGWDSLGLPTRVVVVADVTKGFSSRASRPGGLCRG